MCYILDSPAYHSVYTDTDTHTDRHRHTHTDRHRHTQTHTDTHTDTHTQTHTHTHDFHFKELAYVIGLVEEPKKVSMLKTIR